ncbi:MAG: DUF362 domain-containing protein [Deltaproteobacteria bacterium]|nr:DUF362 domain-containing protein [Deltaproteobacteria bacterium]
MKTWRHRKAGFILGLLQGDDRPAEKTGELISALDPVISGPGKARALVKPNFNNDLPAFTGNSSDLRVLIGVIDWLKARGYKDITVADGPNVGVLRRKIDVFGLLKLRKLADILGFRLLDLNRQPGVKIRLETVSVRIARPVMESDVVINLPTVKTHLEAGFTSSVKNLMGTVVGNDKRKVHRDLSANLAALAARVPTHLQVIDGLVSMEGNGPGDGNPRKTNLLAVAEDPFEADLIISGLLGFERNEVPYLEHAFGKGWLRLDKTGDFPEWLAGRELVKAPGMPLAARIASSRMLYPLKVIARPITDRPVVAAIAKRLGAVQDVYLNGESRAGPAKSRKDLCKMCGECSLACPMNFSIREVESAASNPRCISCNYCVWACPTGALSLFGDKGPLERVIRRYPPKFKKK